MFVPVQVNDTVCWEVLLIFIWALLKCFDKTKCSLEGMKMTKFSLTLTLCKNALFLLQRAGFLQKYPYCTINCTTEILWCTMSHSPFDFFFAHNNIQMIVIQVIFYYINSFISSFIDALELNWTTEKLLQRRLRLIQWQEHLKEKN